MNRYDYEFHPKRGYHYVVDRKRGVFDPENAVARCNSAEDAQKIVDALNALEAVPA